MPWRSNACYYFSAGRIFRGLSSQVRIHSSAMVLLIPKYREVFYVPADFQYVSLVTRSQACLTVRQGLVILMGISNWGNLPTAIVQSVALQDPFDPDTDSALGVACE